MENNKRKVTLVHDMTEIDTWIEGNKMVLVQKNTYSDQKLAEVQQNIILTMMEAAGAIRTSGHDVGKE